MSCLENRWPGQVGKSRCLSLNSTVSSPSLLRAEFLSFLPLWEVRQLVLHGHIASCSQSGAPQTGTGPSGQSQPLPGGTSPGAFSGVAWGHSSQLRSPPPPVFTGGLQNCLFPTGTRHLRDRQVSLAHVSTPVLVSRIVCFGEPETVVPVFITISSLGAGGSVFVVLGFVFTKR